MHLDPRRDGVAVPTWLAKKPQLVLQLGLNFPVPIHDLEIDEAGVRCTLSFNRAPFYCVLPWSAVYALVAEDGQVTVWPSEIPSELVPQAEPAVRRDAPRDKGEKQNKRPRISVVPPPPPLSTDPAALAAANASLANDEDGEDQPAEKDTRRSEPHAPASRGRNSQPVLSLAPTQLKAPDGAVAGSGSNGDTKDAPSPSERPDPPKGPRRTPSMRPPYLRLVK